MLMISYRSDMSVSFVFFLAWIVSCHMPVFFLRV